MFSQVSVCPRGGVSASVPGSLFATPWADTPPPTPPGRHPWADTPVPVHAGIRSTSSRYASHWNAFLLVTEFTENIWVKLNCVLSSILQKLKVRCVITYLLGLSFTCFISIFIYQITRSITHDVS